MNPHSKPARPRPPSEAPLPHPAGKRTPVAQVGAAKHERVAEQHREAVRRHRQRDDRGERVFDVVAPYHEAIVWLVDEGYLAETDLENKAAINAALSRVVLAVIRAPKQLKSGNAFPLDDL